MIKKHIRVLENLLDTHSILVLKSLKNGEMTDGAIAEKLKVRANTIRRVLNELHTKGILTYRKEREKTGWYNYIWRIHDKRLPDFVAKEKSKLLSPLKDRLTHERANTFFECLDGCIKAEYAKTLQNNFKCPMCGNDMKQYNNSKDIKVIEQEIARLEGL